MRLKDRGHSPPQSLAGPPTCKFLARNGLSRLLFMGMIYPVAAVNKLVLFEGTINGDN